MKVLLAIFIGGGLGSVARYMVGRLAMMYTTNAFPWGTFAANVLSCIILGMAVSLLAKSGKPEWIVPLLIVGFCGGFSTFSTFSFETLQLMQAGRYVLAILNIGVSFITCILVLFVLSKFLK